MHLAKLLKGGANLLLLDEPTNDLDVDTLRALEEALLSFAGCAVVISHDRWFLDRIATHMLAFEGDSKVVWFEGNYQDYEADKQSEKRKEKKWGGGGGKGGKFWREGGGGGGAGGCAEKARLVGCPISPQRQGALGGYFPWRGGAGEGPQQNLPAFARPPK